MSDYYWKYLKQRKIKHAFHQESHSMSICGTSPMWYSSSDDLWYSYKEGLEIRKKCGRCVRIMK